MIRQSHTEARELIVSEAIREMVKELRLVDVADYIAFIRLEHFACVADIVDSAAELYFMPGTVKLGNGGDAIVGWGQAPKILLDLELHPRGATVYMTLTLTERMASVEVNYVTFENPDQCPERNTAFLERAIGASRIRKAAPEVAAFQP
ncbi:MAG: hypothetical protein J0H34_08375 [Rhizobiales bacterium]|nr:hypothetical protein [Hyphomicrobiales bacterium]